jgi:hypothetical protein
MLDFDKLLVTGVERGASDLHLKPNAPPILRIHGRLIPQQDLGVLSIEEMDGRGVLHERCTRSSRRQGRHRVRGTELRPLPREHVPGASQVRGRLVDPVEEAGSRTSAPARAGALDGAARLNRSPASPARASPPRSWR